MPRLAARLALAALLAAVVTAGAGLGAHGPHYPFVMDADEVRALAAAWNDQLTAVFGEVLVKFRPGTRPALAAFPPASR